ncbi:YeeE/YedE family protein [Pararhizobium haloflavum]|uniref:YeeE/YedE family protein n=1 Tax=Pararhizobium haloflavum TaxID=2037914 RepID=UPI000C17D4C6|nr:YeeE/YedE family protein [Pararhizobium haloflavum]
MDFIPLIDRFGEGGAALVGGLSLGILFGAAVQRTGFCTRMAVIDMVRLRSLYGPATWIVGFASALLSVQLMQALGIIVIGDSRYFATGQSLSGAAVGGAIFGVGMMLTRGCVSRLIVLSGGGNLRALYGIVVVALAAFATLYGFLGPIRESIASWVSSAAIGGNAIVDHTGGGNFTGAIFALGVTIVALALAARARLGVLQTIGAALVGLAVAGGWYFTATLSQQVFDPIAVDSMSFIRPLAQWSGYAFGAAELPTFDSGLVVGALVGGLVAAVASRSFRIETFAQTGSPSVLRYTVGAVLMGSGGVLAAGCSIGAGLTGGSALAASGLIALTAMVIAGAITDTLVDRPSVDAMASAAQPANR